MYRKFQPYGRDARHKRYLVGKLVATTTLMTGKKSDEACRISFPVDGLRPVLCVRVVAVNAAMIAKFS